MTNSALLLLDCGNSAVKCQLLRVSEQHLKQPQIVFDQLYAAPIQRIENEQASAERLAEAWRGLGAADTAMPLQLSWVSVGPKAVQESVRIAFARLSGIDAAEPWRPNSGEVFKGLELWQFRSRYVKPDQLGADRWVSALGLACQGLIAAGETHMIVSAGTATTIDLVRVEKRDQEKPQATFLGGWILPGIGLMHDALRSKTRDLDGLMGPQIDMHTTAAIDTDLTIPTDSRRAISQGIGLAQTGFVAEIARTHHVTTLWLHGGDAVAWRSCLSLLGKASGMSLTVRDAPHLAFAGLLALARYRA